MNTFKYPFEKQLNVTDNTIKLSPSTFNIENGILEFNDLKKFYELVNDRDAERHLNIIDIGAQTGLYTLFSKYVKNSTFYAFEPFQACYNELCENIKLNDITNVKTFNIALMDKKGSDLLKVDPYQLQLNTLGEHPLTFDPDIMLVGIVDCDTIDNLFYNKDIQVDFIKCDAQGSEYFILMGGINTIKKYKPIIQIEYDEVTMKQCCVTPQMIDDLITDLGYVNISKIGKNYIYKFNTNIKPLIVRSFLIVIIWCLIFSFYKK